jgi:hypothetical protein
MINAKEPYYLTMLEPEDITASDHLINATDEMSNSICILFLSQKELT